MLQITSAEVSEVATLLEKFEKRIDQKLEDQTRMIESLKSSTQARGEVSAGINEADDATDPNWQTGDRQKGSWDVRTIFFGGEGRKSPKVGEGAFGTDDAAFCLFFKP
jgi:hypothetical protein